MDCTWNDTVLKKNRPRISHKNVFFKNFLIPRISPVNLFLFFFFEIRLIMKFWLFLHPLEKKYEIFSHFFMKRVQMEPKLHYQHNVKKEKGNNFTGVPEYEGVKTF